MQQFDHFKSKYDFFYLPIGLMRRANFSNFMNAVGALRFQKASNKYKWNVGSNHNTYNVLLATAQKTSTRETLLSPHLELRL